MDLSTALYHGIYHQTRRVLTAMTDDQLDCGLEAFESGASNWSDCFFAMAFKGEVNLNNVANGPEYWLANRLGLGTNRIPIRIVYSLFDGVGNQFMSKSDLHRLMNDIRDDRRPEDVIAILRGIDFDVATNVDAPSRVSQATCYAGIQE